MKNLYRFLISGLPGKKILLFFVLLVAMGFRAYSQCPTIQLPLPLDKTICSGVSTDIVLHSDIPYTTFNWKITGAKPNTVYGFSDGSGIADASGNYVIDQILVNGSNADHDFTYVITPVANSCSGTPITVVINVKPKMFLTVTPPDPSACSGVPVPITLSADVAGLTFTWNAIPSDSISGYFPGSETSTGFDLPISQTLVNAGVLPHTIVYEVVLSQAGCSSAPSPFTVTVYPNPSLKNLPLTVTQCSGVNFIQNLTSSTAGTSFSWTTNSTAGTTGASAGSGSTINQKLTNNTSTPGTVTYSITPTANGCTGNPVDLNVTVNPIPTVTNSPMNQVVCSGDQTTAVNLLSNVAGTTYTWIASASSISLSGYQTSGSDIIPVQTINNSGLTSEKVTYSIIPSANSCDGLSYDYVISVNPIPSIKSILVKDICSNLPFIYQISADLPGTTFSWVRNSVAGISNPASSGTTATISETLVNTTSSDIDVTYLLTLYGPAPLQCAANPQTLVVTVHALPQVSAGPDLTIKHGMSTSISGNVSGTAPLNYTWTPAPYLAGGVNTTTLQTTNLYATQAFTLTSTNAFGCTNSSSMTVNVVGPPLATTPTASSAAICSGENSTLYVHASGGSENYTYSWVSQPAGFTSDKDIITVSPLVTTIYTVTVNDGYNTESATVSVIVNALPGQYPLSGGGAYCKGSAGALTGLSGSQSGVNYQLYKGVIPIGAPVAGTNSAISFGNQMAGTYTVTATSASGCVSDMNGAVTLVINPLPTIYEIRPMGSKCPGTIIWLNGSDKNVTYELLLNGNPIASMAGTGFEELLGFGPQTANGTYTVKAVNNITGCQALMNGSTYINIAPKIFNVIPAGILCPGRTISLTGSETGVNYQLRRNGSFDLYAPVPGTGSAINMGIGDLPALYSVIAVNAATQCVSYMADSATLYPDPVIFTMSPDGPACEGDAISLNGSQVGVNYILLLDNAIHLDTLQGTGRRLDFGSQLTAGNYTVIAVRQNSYCITQMNGIAVFKASPVKYDILPAGVVCKGNAISLASSQRGVSYQLFLNDITLVGSPVRGTGASISFGPQNAPGKYTVQAVNDLTGCYAMMNGPVRLYPAPVTFQVAPAGNNCPGTIITLNGSERGFSYILLRDGLYPVDTLAGTGSPLSFGTPMIAGNYTVVALTVAASCPSQMNGSSTIIPAMTTYNVTPTGFNCTGSMVGLDGSQIGITYQLKRNGNENISSLAGTGSALNFGVMNLPGIYTVVGINFAKGCVGTMNGKADLEPSPLSFSLVNVGIQCAETEIFLSGSETGVYYVLMADGVFAKDTLDGTGKTLNFGPQRYNGTYTINAYKKFSGCKTAMQGSITIIQPPITFNVYPFAMICAPAIIGLDGSQAGYNYILYEDGVSTGITVPGTGNPISFGTQPAGNYTIEAVSMVTGCRIFMTSSVAAGLNFNFSATESCIGEATNFTPRLISPTGNTMVSFLWNFGDPASGSNNTSTLRQPSHKYSLQSTYIVTLTVQDVKKCTTTVYGQAVVYALPEPAFSYLEGNCDSIITFKNLTNTNGSNVSKWIWQFGDGQTDTILPPKSPNVSHLYSHSGEYYVTFTSINDHGCQASISDTVRMFPCMVSQFRVNDTPACQGKTVSFSDMSSGGGPISKWHWDFGDGSTLIYTAKKYTVDHVYKNPGTFNVKLIITTQIAGGIKNDSVSHQVKVDPSPSAEYSVAETCLGIASEFKNNTTGNGSLAIKYAWSFGESGTLADTSSLKDPSYTYRQAGDFAATLLATNTAGCSGTVIHNVKVNPIPAAKFQNSTACSNSQTHFTDGSQSVNAPLRAWKWDFLDSTNVIGHSDLRNPDFLFPKGGNFGARLTVTDNKGCKNTSSGRIVVHAAPVSAFSIKDYYDNVQGKVELSNQSLNATTFEWDFGNGSSSTNDAPIKIYDRDGSYIIRLIAYNEVLCSDTLEKPYMLLFKGLYVPNAFSPLSTFSNELLFKPVGMNLKTYQVEVFDSWGNLMWSSTKLDESGSPVDSWDGTYKGNLLQQDVYIWKITAVFRDGTVWGSNDNVKTSGTVTLLR